MLQYPSILKNVIDIPIYAFDKIDGSNIRVEWSRKNGFSKFGTRTRLLDEYDEKLAGAIPVFNETMADSLVKPLEKLKVERATLFMEYYGDNSFAGYHEPDEQHYLKLFDVSLYKKGFMLPEEFLRSFESEVPMPELLYHGDPTAAFIEQVESGSLEGMTFEGVVCKSQELRRNKQVKFKVKNKAWLDKLKEKYIDDPKMFEKLA